MMVAGHLVFSPIAHSHPMFERVPETGAAWEDWVRLNHMMIDFADEVWVLTLEGWERSRGVADEIEYAGKTFKPVLYVHPDLQGVLPE